jgi:hypothetical protein
MWQNLCALFFCSTERNAKGRYLNFAQLSASLNCDCNSFEIQKAELEIPQRMQELRGAQLILKS